MSIEILDSGACKAMGQIDVTADVNPARTFVAGIRRIISTGVNGRVRLVLEEGIGQHELVAHVTPLPPAIGNGIIPAVQWVDNFTIDIETYDRATGALAAAQVRFSFYRILNLAAPAVDAALPNPQQILGNNLAVWLQGDLGTDGLSPGAPVTTWVNQVANGDAVQGVNPDAPVFSPNSFGSRPGVSGETPGAGLVLTLTTPWAIGQRPYFWQRGRLNSLVHTPGVSQNLATAFPIAFGPGSNELFISADASGTFGPTAFWDWVASTAATVDTFLELAELDTLPHTLQNATQQAGALVFDGSIINAPAPIAALTSTVDTIYLNRTPAPFIAPSPGFWNIGVFVAAYDQPTADEIAAVAAWCNAYN
jgi:hypothetical protein